MIAKLVERVVVLSGLGLFSNGIGQTQQASLMICNERTIL
jgi:hypothetical protein